MIKLIREYFESAIRMQVAAEKAFETSIKSHTKNIEYLDNQINRDLIREEREIALWEEQMDAAKKINKNL
jgi:hypothetical protein